MNKEGENQEDKTVNIVIKIPKCMENMIVENIFDKTKNTLGKILFPLSSDSYVKTEFHEKYEKICYFVVIMAFVMGVVCFPYILSPHINKNEPPGNQIVGLCMISLLFSVVFSFVCGVCMVFPVIPLIGIPIVVNSYLAWNMCNPVC